MIILIETRILLQSGWWESMTWIIHFENAAYILSNHKYQCYQMVTCESDCFLQSLRGELTQENEQRRLPLDVLLAWGCITLLGSSASAIIGAITLYNNSLFWPPGMAILTATPFCYNWLLWSFGAILNRIFSQSDLFSIGSFLNWIFFGSPPYAIFQ